MNEQLWLRCNSPELTEPRQLHLIDEMRLKHQSDVNILRVKRNLSLPCVVQYVPTWTFPSWTHFESIIMPRASIKWAINNDICKIGFLSIYSRALWYQDPAHYIQIYRGLCPFCTPSQSTLLEFNWLWLHHVLAHSPEGGRILKGLR